MKLNFLLLNYLILIPAFLSALEINTYTFNLKKGEYQNQDTISKNTDSFHVNFYSGIYQNKTFGLHPILGVGLGYRLNNKSSIYLAAEFRFGNSKNYYDFVVNDSIINTKHYLGEFAGIEYDRLLFSKKQHEIISTLSIGYDVINSPVVDDEIQRRHGFAFNLGLGYLFKFKNGAGPHIKFVYHYANIKNDNGTHPNNNSFCLRLTYILGYIK
jgi:hypothetical protein